MKISFHSHANKTNFHKQSFALSLAFIMRFTATRKWPIEAKEDATPHGNNTCLKISTHMKFSVTTPKNAKLEYEVWMNALANGIDCFHSAVGVASSESIVFRLSEKAVCKTILLAGSFPFRFLFLFLTNLSVWCEVF